MKLLLLPVLLRHSPSRSEPCVMNTEPGGIICLIPTALPSVFAYDRSSCGRSHPSTWNFGRGWWETVEATGAEPCPKTLLRCSWSMVHCSAAAMATSGTRTQRKGLLSYQPISVPMAAYWEIGFPVASQCQPTGLFVCCQPIRLENSFVKSRFVRMTSPFYRTQLFR